MSINHTFVGRPYPPLAIADLGSIASKLERDCDSLSDSSIFITGGSGLIGKWLVQSLLHADKVMGLGLQIGLMCRDPTRLSTELPDLANDSRITYYRSDIREASAELISGHYDFFIHAATSVADPGPAYDTLDVCIRGTQAAIDLAVKMRCSRFLLLSSGAVYGSGQWPDSGLTESDQGFLDFSNGASAYAYGKRCAELLCMQAADQHPIEFVIARCFAMLGPYLALDRHYAVGNFIGAALRRNPITIKGDGTPIRSYLYMSDVAQHLLGILIRGSNRTAYNVGSNRPLSIKAIAERVNEVLGAGVEVRVEGRSLHGPHASQYLPSVLKIRNDLALDQTVGIDEAILSTAMWYQKWILH